MAVSRDFKPWHVYLGIGLALIPIYFAFASGGNAQSAVFLVINGAAPLAVLYGIRLHRPALRLPWDNGTGLAPGEVERVFEHFFRSSRAVDSQIPGTGLGLFIAKAIAEAHGGSISVSSRGQGGTTFRIELPAQLEAGARVPDGELVV